MIVLLIKPLRTKPWIFYLMLFLTCTSITINRYVLTVQGLAQPVMPSTAGTPTPPTGPNGLAASSCSPTRPWSSPWPIATRPSSPRNLNSIKNNPIPNS